jgi:NAD-dependent SIR2 family protein deacetylase
MPLHARDAGATLAIVNLEPTPQDHRADLVIRARAGDVMAEVVQRLDARPAGKGAATWSTTS